MWATAGARRPVGRPSVARARAPRRRSGRGSRTSRSPGRGRRAQMSRSEAARRRSARPARSRRGTAASATPRAGASASAAPRSRLPCSRPQRTSVQPHPNDRLREYHLSHTDVRYAAIPYGALTTNRSRRGSRRPEEGEEMATTTARPAALVHPKPNEAGASDALTRDDRTSLLRYMLLMRATEERGLTLYRQGK